MAAADDGVTDAEPPIPGKSAFGLRCFDRSRVSGGDTGAPVLERCCREVRWGAFCPGLGEAPVWLACARRFVPDYRDALE